MAALRQDLSQAEQISTVQSADGELECHNDLTMEFANPMPSRIAAGQAIEIPVVVLFRHKTKPAPDMNNIWVFVSLINEESGGAPQEDLLQGQRADSIHLLGDENGKDGNFAYASFANLVVSTRGRYRFRMTAVDMKR